MTLTPNKFDRTVERRTNRMIILVILILLTIIMLSIDVNSQPKTAYMVTVNHQWQKMEILKADSTRLDSICATISSGMLDSGIMDSTQFIELRTEHYTLYIERKEEREDGSLRRRKFKPNK